MAKKIVKRKKLKIRVLLLILLVLGGLVFACYEILQLPIKNTIVKNNNYLPDDYILEKANIKDYPSYFLLNTNKSKKKLEKSPYIKKATVTRGLYRTVTVKIVENTPLYFDETTKKVVFENQKSVKVKDLSIFRIPRVLNHVPENKIDSFIKGMKNINEDTLSKISDIEYQPNEIDKDRFLLYMDDGNMVYLTLTKFKQINYYNEVLTQLENKKGILYLDNGNHFQIKG